MMENKISAIDKMLQIMQVYIETHASNKETQEMMNAYIRLSLYKDRYPDGKRSVKTEE
jgi:hypothetical protein